MCHAQQQSGGHHGLFDAWYLIGCEQKLGDLNEKRRLSEESRNKI